MVETGAMTQGRETKWRGRLKGGTKGVCPIQREKGFGTFPSMRGKEKAPIHEGERPLIERNKP